MWFFGIVAVLFAAFGIVIYRAVQDDKTRTKTRMPRYGED